MGSVHVLLLRVEAGKHHVQTVAAEHLVRVRATVRVRLRVRISPG